MALTKASREINKNTLKMGKIGQVMSLAGVKLRVSRLAFAFQRSDTHMPPIRFLAFFCQSDLTSRPAPMPQKMPNLSRNLPRNVTYYFLSSFHTYSEAVMIGAINTGTANLLAGVSEDDDEDPFAGLEEDEDELEENETVLDDC